MSLSGICRPSIACVDRGGTALFVFDGMAPAGGPRKYDRLSCRPPPAAPAEAVAAATCCLFTEPRPGTGQAVFEELHEALRSERSQAGNGNADLYADGSRQRSALHKPWLLSGRGVGRETCATRSVVCVPS
jgi:hypothetical protein